MRWTCQKRRRRTKTLSRVQALKKMTSLAKMRMMMREARVVRRLSEGPSKGSRRCARNCSEDLPRAHLNLSPRRL